MNRAVASARQRIRALLTDTCTVVAPTQGTPDGRGGWTDGTPTTVYTDVICAVQTPSETDVTEETRQRLRGRTMVRVAFETDKVIAMGYRVIRGAETYEVIGTPVLGSNALTLAVTAARNTP